MSAASSRRDFLKGAAALGLLSAVPGCATRATLRRDARDPFTLGVASGYPAPGGFVLWTRLAPQPLAPGGGMRPETFEVGWEVAEDDRLRRIVQRGAAWATPDWAHAVHVEVGGLAPDRWYWYRFHAGDAASPIGRTRTAPGARARPARCRFAVASCQHWEHGYFGAYRQMLDDELDLVVHVGDYIYESSWGTGSVRSHRAPEPYTLDDYRARHALYRTDPDLRAAHAAIPWIVTWDDHEVDNDYAGARSEELDAPELFLLRRAAAYRAYYEHMPLPRRAVALGPHALLHARQRFGDLVAFHVLDDRQYRDAQVCAPAGRGGSNVVADCAERLDPARTLLGAEQEAWLHAGLGSRARWNVIAQQTRVAPLDLAPGPDERWWTDGWDGYPAARQRLLDALAGGRARNPLLVGGDVHSFWVSDLHADPADRKSPIVAAEFVTTSISSQGASSARYEKVLAENPHVRFADGDHRGYTRIEITGERATADLRGMEDVTVPGAPCRTLATFVVDAGRPGAVRA